MGNYEHMETYAVMEINTEVDQEFQGKSTAEIFDFIDNELLKFMEDDVFQAKKITDNRDSAAFRFAELNY